jgi:hypothetical protein
MNHRSARRFARAVTLWALLTPLSGIAAEWSEIGVDDDGNRYAIDESATRREGSRVRLTVRAEYAKPHDDTSIGEAVLGAIDRLVVDCELRRFALESRVYRTVDLREVPAIARSREELVFLAAPPRSISADIVGHACQR